MGFTREEKQDFQEEAWKLRLQGKSMRAIGEALGLSAGYVCQLLQKALEDKKEELVGTAEKHIANQAGRLDSMLEALWEKVQAGDPKAIAAALAIEDRRSKLLGLDVAQRKALDITTGGESVSFKITIPIADRIRGAEGEDA
jgi:hypothetical protein